MGRVTKPCPACKTTTYHRQADGICTECERLIWEAKQNREALAKALAEGGPEVLYQEPWFWPYFHRPGRSCTVDPAFERMNMIFCEMMRAVGRVEVSGEKNWDNAKSYDWGHSKTQAAAIQMIKPRDSGIRSTVWLKPEFAKLLVEMDGLVHQVIEVSYKIGFREGQSLLTGLADGTMSINKFNEEVTDRLKKP